MKCQIKNLERIRNGEINVTFRHTTRKLIANRKKDKEREREKKTQRTLNCEVIKFYNVNRPSNLKIE